MARIPLSTAVMRLARTALAPTSATTTTNAFTLTTKSSTSLRGLASFRSKRFADLTPPIASQTFSRCISNTSPSQSSEEYDPNSHVHFRASGRPHPLSAKQQQEQDQDQDQKGAQDVAMPSTPADASMSDHLGRQQNHIWSAQELQEKMSTLYRHEPKTVSDHIMHKLMYTLYNIFNRVTGYTPIDPSVKAMEWRLILLESIAGVPGFIGAGFRHFRSLRKLKRDHGWIATLLEEAENERMHLLICLGMFKAGAVTRALVMTAQVVMVPFLFTVYFVHPKSLHRFVGYLEETACYTYVNTIRHIETPGTKLHDAWANTRAPPIAVGYYRLPKDAMWVDALKCMMADEANHRDVNHTFADMKTDDPNPFVEKHKQDAIIAWRLNNAGEPAMTKEDLLKTTASKL
mmetsp:Transcript_1078/g.1749  ORF Transcript_1078/g.1749 Transcript_1078/m.1749 type:complete len:403 (-) Transcript_1078:173-1381(-)